MPALKSLLVDLFLVALATVAAAVTRDNFEIIAPRLLGLVPYLVITLSVAGFVLPAFYRRSEPTLDLARSFLSAFGRSVLGTAVHEK